MPSDHSSEQGPTINIRGTRVGLGPRDPSMLDALTRWINIFETRRTLSDPRPVTRAEEEAWLSQTPQDHEVVFVIYDLEDMAPVGVTNLFNIDHRHQRCELGISILDPDRRGKGLGTEAVRLVTDYAIHGLEMHNVELAAYEYNWAGLRAYAKAGFKESGRRREAHLYQGKRWDLIFMDVVASEWESPVMKEMMAPDEQR